MIEPKPEIANTPPAHHGAFDYDELAQLGFSPDEVIDFSVNSNPYGPPPGVREAIAAVPLDRYPDRECIALRGKLAERHSVAMENIVVGNGTAELLMLVAMAFIRPGDKVLMVEPAFSEYARIASLTGANIQAYTTYPDQDFEIKFDALDRITHQTKPRVLIFSNPNNPSGMAYPSHSLMKIAQNCPDTLVISDEAYLPFIKSHGLICELHYFITSLKSDVRRVMIGDETVSNIISLRSMTKDYALAGLRLGYAIGNPDVIEAVRRMCPAWNVNGLAQAAGIAALGQEDWLRHKVVQLSEHKTELIKGLCELGLNPLPSSVHYFLVNVGNGAAFRSKLLQHKIMVRDCASFGLSEYVRIATRTPEDNAKLLAAVEQVQHDR